MRLGALLAALALAAAAGRGGAAEAPAPRVRDVELRIDAALGRGVDPRSFVAIVPGEPLHEAAVRRTLASLYATGAVAEAEVLRRPAEPPPGAIPGEEWVTAVVVARGRTWVEEVELSGEPKLKGTELRRALEQRPGTPLNDDAVERGRDALRQLYASRGFREAEVEVTVAPLAGERRVGVTYHLTPGPRARIDAANFTGDLGPFTAAELRRELRSEPGEPYDRERLAEDAERLAAWLVKQGYLTAEVEPPSEAYDPVRHAVTLTFPLAVGPRIEVEVMGVPRRQLEKQGLLPFLRERSLDETLLDQSRERIETFFERQGHFHATASFELSDLGAKDGGRRLRIAVDPGPRYTLEEIDFTGNEQIPDRELLPLLTTTTRRGLGGDGGRLVHADLEADLANLRSYYLLQGFTEVAVGPPVIREEGTELRLAIPIVEGERRRVVTLTLAGNASYSEDELRRALPLRSGGPFHPVLLDDALNILRTLYEERGYLTASAVPALDWNAEHTLVDVHLQIYEGPQTVVDQVVLRGYHHTRPETLRRFVALAPGDPLSRRRLLEVERDLYRLGIFSRVEVEMAPLGESPARRDVIVRVEEGRQWRLAYGVSYNSDSGAGGLFSLSRANVGGRGDRLQLDLRGDSLDRRYRLIFDQPSFLRSNIPITYTLFRQEEERESFTVDSLGAQVSLTKDLRTVRLGLVYDYRLVDLSTVPLDPGEIEREDRELEVSSVTPNLFVDRRDDPLDPGRGWSTAVQLEYAFPFLSAETEFLKLFWQQTQYVPLGPAGVFAASLRVGAIEPLDSGAVPDPLVPPGLPSALVPVSERFFAGGRTSHRAYERDQLGIPGETTLVRDDGGLVELGGNGLFVVNLDYRFPILGSFGGTVFLDLGNVWADWRDLDPSRLEAGAGVGLRYRSPIGPLRIDVGWKLDPELPDDGAVFFLSFGNPF